MSHSNYVHLDVSLIKAETDKAFLVVFADDDLGEVWVPKSHIADADDYSKGNKDLTLSVSEWFAGKEGLI